MMKRGLFLMVVSVIVSAGVCGAWEKPQNPDRFPSVGFTLNGQAMEGDWMSPSAPVFGSQDVETNTSSLIVDTRLPLSNSFTLSLALGSIASETTYKETSTLNSQEIESDGGFFSIGARFYFNR